MSDGWVDYPSGTVLSIPACALLRVNLSRSGTVDSASRGGSGVSASFRREASVSASVVSS